MSDSPLRFCIVSTFYPPWNFGGDGIYAHRLANGLARRGHRVTVLHSPSAYEMLAGGPPRGAYQDRAGVEVHGIRTPLGSLGLLLTQQIGYPCLQAPALRALLHDGAFDVIHYNNVSLLGGPHVFRYGRGLKLCTLIEHWLVCPTHVLWKFNREVCTRPSCVRCQLIHRRPPQWWRHTGLMRRATKSIDAFIGPSLFTMRMHRQRGIRGRMVQLPLFDSRDGVPVAAPQRQNDGRPYFLFVGRLEKIKGVQTIIPTFRETPDADLLIAGNGNYEGELQRLAEGAANIRFLGRTSRAELEALYRDAIATIVPSLCYETFGIIVAESFCASTPVIVYAQSSLEEIVRTHGGGLMYRTPDELSAALRRLRDEPDLRDRLGREGRTAYEAEFGEEPFLSHYLDVVHALLEEKRAGNAAAAPTLTRDGVPMLAGRPVFE